MCNIPWLSLFVCSCFTPIATIFSYIIGVKMWRRSLSLHWQTEEIFNAPHHIGMVWEKLTFDDAVSYMQWGKWIAAQLNVIAMTGIHTHVPRVTYLHVLTNWANPPTPLWLICEVSAAANRSSSFHCSLACASNTEHQARYTFLNHRFDSARVQNLGSNPTKAGA